MIPKRFEPILFAFIMSLFMSFFMSCIITFINLGLVDWFIVKWLGAFWKAFVIAFPTIFVVVPTVRKVVAKLVVQENRS